MSTPSRLLWILVITAIALTSLSLGSRPAPAQDVKEGIKKEDPPPPPGKEPAKVEAGMIRPLFKKPRPASAEQIGQWIKDLGDRTYKVREAATRSLEETGPAAMKALQAAAQTGDEEIRRRVQLLCEKIEIHEALAPSFIDLKVQDKSVPEVVELFSKQSKIKLSLIPQQGPGRHALERKRITLALHDAPFWEALDKLCQAGGLGYNPVGTDTLQLQAASGDAHPPVASSGPFRMRITGMNYSRGVNFFGMSGNPSGVFPGMTAANRSENLSVNLDVLSEPNVRLLAFGGVQISEAVDENGQSLVFNSGTSATYSNYNHHSPGTMQPLTTSFSLRPSSKTGATLQVLRGSLPVEVLASRKALLTVDDLMGNKGRLVKGPGELVLAILQVQDHGGGRNGNIRFALSGVERLYDPSRGYDPEPHRQRFELTDAQGRRYNINLNFNYSGNPNDKLLEGNLYFNANQDVGPAARLVYYDQKKVRTSIPFEFKNVPMP
jgi:hypothetical protein